MFTVTAAGKTKKIQAVEDVLLFVKGFLLENTHKKIRITNSHTHPIARKITWTERLQKLGFATYDQYLCSPHWQVFKQEFWNQTHRICFSCKSTHQPLSIHHLTYKRLGKEKISDVVPLCTSCHEKIHLFATDRRISIKKATYMIAQQERATLRVVVPASR